MSDQDPRVGAHNTGVGPTSGDSANGAPQVESGGGGRDNEIHVNQAFIDAHGPEAGMAYKAVLERVGANNHGGDIVEIREQLTLGLAEASIEVAPVEIDNMSDRIARSQRTHVDADDVHAQERAADRVVEG